MRIGYLDAFSGVAGDMWVGALLDAGLPIEPLAAAVASLQLPGVTIEQRRVQRAGLSGTKFNVLLHGAPAEGAATEGGAATTGAPVVQFVPAGGTGAGVTLPGAGGHQHRRLRDIEAILSRAAVPAVVAAQCRAVYRAIAEAEAKAHDCGVDDVHFHEVGAEDTIVDVLCACLGTHLLGIERLYASAIAVGSGTVRAAHGVLPVPAPATAHLLAGVPVRQGTLPGERTTPTGAALLKVLVHEFEPRLVWVPERSGYGAGTRDDADTPNLLRLVLGEQRAPSSPTALVELQCHVDTATGETIGWLLDELLARGAVDAFAAPVVMKKGRVGYLLTALTDDGRQEVLTRLLLEEANTLGVRLHRVDRAVLERWSELRTTACGEVRFKVARLPSGAVVARPEDDEVRRLCRELGIGRSEVLRRLAVDG